MFCILFLALVISFAFADDPPQVPPVAPVPTGDQTSLVVFVTPSWVKVSSKLIFDEVTRILLSFNIPDYDATINTSIGKIEISITDMSITEFNTGEVITDLNSASQSLFVHVEDNQFAMSFSYKLQQLSFPYKGEEGFGTVSTTDMMIGMAGSCTQNTETGGTNLKIEDVQVDVGDFTVDMQGGLVANVISTLESLFADVIDELISDAMSQFLADFLYPYMDYLAEKGYFWCDGNDFCIDYRLSKDPKVSDEGVYVYMKGTYYDPQHDNGVTDAIFDPVIDITAPYDISESFGNATFQSLFSVMHLENRWSLRNMSTGVVEPATLNYDDIVAFYPQWATAYPNGTAGQLSIITSEEPTSQIMYNGLKVDIYSTISLTPLGLEDTTNINSAVHFTMLGDFYWVYNHDCKDEYLKNTNFLSLKLYYNSASVTNSEMSKDWVEKIINELYLPQVNYDLDARYISFFTLPGVTFYNYSVTYNGDYVLVSTDMKFE